ncbi:hypothetical protein BS17DRAFT_39945 [Gyrodon lividus]|nr:hypothetical protein BS17DRAFT_39945 [Gyrodon lividus]
MAQLQPPPVTVLPVPIVEPEFMQEREADLLLNSEEVAENTRALAQDPAIFDKFQRLWRRLWPADVVDEWAKKQTEPCVECQKRSLKCESKRRAIRCIPCARFRRGPCSRWRAFQIHQVGLTLKLSPAVTEALARQLEFNSAKSQSKTSKKRLFKPTPVMPSSVLSSMRLLQRTSYARRSRSPEIMFTPTGETADDSVVGSSSQIASQSVSHAPTYLRIKLPPLSRRSGTDVGPSVEGQVGGLDLEDEHRSSIASCGTGGLHQSLLRTPEEPVSPNLIWPPDGEAIRSISVTLSEPSYEPPPPIEPIITLSEPSAHSPPENPSAEKGRHSPRSTRRSPQPADVISRNEEIASLKGELAVREREIASMRQEMQALASLRNPPPQLPAVTPLRRAPISENDNRTRRYLSLQYIARTLKGAREANTSEEERNALLVRAEHHLTRLANLEMEGIWRSDVDSDELFASFARDNWGDDTGNTRKRRRTEG